MFLLRDPPPDVCCTITVSVPTNPHDEYTYNSQGHRFPRVSSRHTEHGFDVPCSHLLPTVIPASSALFSSIDVKRSNALPVEVEIAVVASAARLAHLLVFSHPDEGVSDDRSGGSLGVLPDDLIR